METITYMVKAASLMGSELRREHKKHNSQDSEALRWGASQVLLWRIWSFSNMIEW